VVPAQERSGAAYLQARLKVVQIALGAVIPFLAGLQARREMAPGIELDLPALLIAVLGVIVVVLEGVQHLEQYQKTWLEYRSEAEALTHDHFLVLADAGPYAQVSDKRARLAERMQELIASEHSRWVAARSRGKGDSGA
jgi:hypothetical protein